MKPFYGFERIIKKIFKNMKKKEELFAGIKNLFDSYNFSEDYLSKAVFSGPNYHYKFNRIDFDKIIVDLCELFKFNSPEFSEIKFENKKSKRPQLISNYSTDKLDGYSLGICRMYPRIIVSDCKFSISEFKEVYKFLLENNKEIRKEEYGFSQLNKTILNIIIKGAYGYGYMFADNKSKFKIVDGHKIVEFVNKFTEDISTKFPEHFHQICVDEIICKNLDAAEEICMYITENYSKYNFDLDISRASFEFSKFHNRYVEIKNKQCK